MPAYLVKGDFVAQLFNQSASLLQVGDIERQDEMIPRPFRFVPNERCRRQASH
jgi:hypothetical protein